MSLQTSSMVTVGNSILATTNKRGILKPDADGYYTIPLGMYGTNNSAGMFYDGASGAAMFMPNTPLMRRLDKNVLFMEFKHPEPWENVVMDGKVVKRYMSDNEYLMRIRRIDDDRVCGHIRKLFLDNTVKDETGRMAIMVYGEVKPYGPYGKHLQESLDNPDINTYASVRSITRDDMLKGIKYTCEISTWDMVGEGGIYKASKYHAPGLEAHQENDMLTSLQNAITITPETLRKVEAESIKRKQQGLESGENYDVSELRTQLGWTTAKAVRKPYYLK